MFLGSLPDYNLIFNQSYDSEFEKIAWVNTIVENDYVTINFNMNPDVVGNATGLVVARTIYHESIHAYWVLWAKHNPSAASLTYPQLFDKRLELRTGSKQNQEQHNLMTKEFMSDIAKSISIFGNNRGYDIPFSYYEDFAWKGLTGTKAFENLPAADQQRIRDVIKKEQYGITKNNETQKGSKLDC